MTECALCRSSAEQPYRVVFRDMHTVVMLSYEPIKPGHMMVLPARHAENLSDLDPSEAQSFLRTVDRCTAALARLYEETPMTLINGWKFRSQPHLHLHVLPSANDCRGLYAASENSPYRTRATPDILKANADALRAVF